MFNFVFDREVNGQPWPNLAAGTEYAGMGDEYPWIVPLRLLYYAKDHDYPVNIYYIGQLLPNNSYYPVGIGFFDYSIDYFSMMSEQVLDLCRENKLKILFYYHEGDNPYLEQRYLDRLCLTHNLPDDCYRFVSGNTASDDVAKFIFFPDHELFYWRNSVVWNDQVMPACTWHNNPRGRDFTLLSRVHKWWRASVVAHLHSHGILNNSYWSYGVVDIADPEAGNPIEIFKFDELRRNIKLFLKGAPYRCDNLTSDEHNSHWMLVCEHFEDSYCHLVLETFFDVDGSRGAFLTEKTFKPIRHAQPFVIIGPAHSLATLKRLGYRTYDHAIDNLYDREENNTKRFSKLIAAIEKLHKQDLHTWIAQCEDDAKYNQELFVSSKRNRLEQLATNLNAI